MIYLIYELRWLLLLALAVGVASGFAAYALSRKGAGTPRRRKGGWRA